MKSFIFYVCLIINLFSLNAYSDNSSHILEAIKEDKNYSVFYKAIIKSGMKELFLKETKYKKTVYIPSDKAFSKLPEELKKIIWSKKGKNMLKKVVRTHIYMGSIKEVFKDPSKTVKSYDRFEVDGQKVKVYQNSELFVKDMIKKGKEKVISEDIIIPVSCVMFLQSVDTDDRLDDDTKEKYNVTSCCLFTDDEIENFLKNNNI